mgnify:CR=1 FL=1|tara:strand:+ start:93 stop:410 length:318 start_codon:yes stop_codon:yes gene_type:complete
MNQMLNKDKQKKITWFINHFANLQKVNKNDVEILSFDISPDKKWLSWSARDNKRGFQVNGGGLVFYQVNYHKVNLDDGIGLDWCLDHVYKTEYLTKDNESLDNYT